jgi:hypothetical protein
MAIEYAREPSGGADLVQGGVERALDRHSPLSGLGLAPAEVEVEQPHPIYDLRADEVAAGGGLESAHPAGYRYLVRSGGSAVAAGEVATDEQGAATSLSTLNYGQFVAGTADAVAKLEDLDAVKAHQYELRLLRFSAAYVMALWLKSQEEGKDIIYPLAPAPSPLKADTPYSPDEFFAAVVPLAQERVAGAGERSVP